MKKIIILVVCLLSACAKLSRDLSREEVYQWKIEDQGVIYPLERLSKINNTKYLHLQKIFLTKKKKKVVEKLKVVSARGILKKSGLQVLRPEYAYLELWIDKKRNVTKLELDNRKHAFKVGLMNAKGVSSFYVPFPKSAKLVCFFSQLIDCMRVTGFFDKVRELHSGRANLFLIMEGAYLYSELYEYYPQQLFIPAEFVFDRMDKDKRMKFTLSFAKQNIYFTVDKFLKFYSMYWIAQQLNIVPVKSQ